MPAVNMRQVFFVMPVNSYDEYVSALTGQDFSTNYNNILDKDAMASRAFDQSKNDFISQFLAPGNQQDKEFAQEVTLQNMQNEWNSEVSRMQRMKEAGINPNVAASGIAGSGNAPSVGSPNTAVGSGSSALGSTAQLAEAADNAVNAGMNAYEKLSLTSTERQRRIAETSNLLASAFHNEWLGRAVAEMLPLQKDNERADTWLKLANFDKAREERKLIVKRVDEAQAHIDELQAQASLYKKQGNLVDAEVSESNARTARIQLENDKLQWDKDFRDKWHFDNTKPLDSALIEAMMYDDGDANGVVNTIGKAVEFNAKSERKGFNEAEIEDAYTKAFSELKAKADVDAEFAPYLAAVEANKSTLIEFMKMLTENPDDIKGIFAKLVNLIGNIGLSTQLDKGVVNNAKKPAAGVNR